MTEASAIAAPDRFVEFRSQLGNSIVHPSQWSREDKGDHFSISAPDGHAVISALTFTVEGSGSLSDFQNAIVSSQCAGNWRASSWVDITIGGMAAKKRHLASADNADVNEWRVYVLRNGECYHALLLNASPLAMELNGDFYEEVAQSFEGLSKLP